MADLLSFARAPVLASAVGSVLLMAFWAACLFGPAMLVGVAAHRLEAATDMTTAFALASLAVTLFVFKRAVDHPWRGM